MSSGPKRPPLFQSFKRPADEDKRIEALHATRLLQRQSDEVYANLIHLATLITGKPMGFLDIVKEETVLVWAHKRGFDVEVPHSQSFCATTIRTPEKVTIVEDATQDLRFRNLDAVVNEPGIRFYAGAPIFSDDGYAIGTICVADTEPGSLTEDQRDGLRILAEAVTARIKLQLSLESMVAERKKFEAFMDGGPTVNFIKDHTGRYTYVNQRFLKAFGVRKEDILGKRDAELWPEVGEQIATHDRWVLRQSEPVELSEQGPQDEQGKPTWWRSYKFSLPGDQPSLGGISLDISELQNIQNQLRLQAGRDVLTGLQNRSALNEELPVALISNQQRNETLGVLYMDLDHFKSINDTHGHAAGDELLKEFSQRIVGALRTSDRVYRLGGDEFVVVLQHLHNEAEAAAIAQKILDTMHTPVALTETVVRISASIGIACVQGKMTSPDVLIHQADLALYEAKRLGRNRYAMAG